MAILCLCYNNSIWIQNFGKDCFSTVLTMCGPRALKLHLSNGRFPALLVYLLNSQGFAWKIKVLPYCLRRERLRFQDSSLKHYEIMKVRWDLSGPDTKTPSISGKSQTIQETYAELQICSTRLETGFILYSLTVQHTISRGIREVLVCLRGLLNIVNFPHVSQLQEHLF